MLKYKFILTIDFFINSCYNHYLQNQMNQKCILMKKVKISHIKVKKFFTASRIIIAGFAAVIILGALLLMLPFSSAEHAVTPFKDALFTAVSATCVTGLVVRDTATYWSLFGQIIILVMIQIGGMGIITIAVFFTRIMGGKIGIMQRTTMQEAVAAPQVGGIVKLTGFIIRTSMLIELVGALALSPVFIKDFGWVKGIWYSVFHSVSAFCNAGFDLMGVRLEFSSLTSYSGNLLVNIVIMLLIITGGIGFLTWDDIKNHGFHFKKYRMQSKVVLLMTVFLLAVPSVYFYLAEFSSPLFNDMTAAQKVLASFFQTVTARTAGFNTIDFNLLSETGRFLMIMLMLIGGCSGSTAGGMKTTTIAVLFASAVSVFKRRRNARLHGRRIEDETVKTASSIFFMYLSLFSLSAMAISFIEKIPLVDCLFETASAIATVGVTMGITPNLSSASHIILMCLMFFGRVGGLTLIYATFSKRADVSMLPQEKIMVG